jgi:hypothetical protein
LWLTKFTKDLFAEHLSRLYGSTVTSRPSLVDFNVEVSYQGTELYKFEEVHQHLLILAPDEQKNDLKEV